MRPRCNFHTASTLDISPRVLARFAKAGTLCGFGSVRRRGDRRGGAGAGGVGARVVERGVRDQHGADGAPDTRDTMAAGLARALRPLVTTTGCERP